MSSPFCDICWKRPDVYGMTFRSCRKCGVGVHDECYGYQRHSEPVGEFECWACKAVGTTVTVRSGKKITIKDRPTACSLCSVDDKNDWLHAMHPIYDDGGNTGRHALVPGENKTLAWAHTLCCFYINTAPLTAGCVYGCTPVGHYTGIEGENHSGDPVNPDLADGDPADHTVHHFVYCSTLHGENNWTRALSDVQEKLKCYLCGTNDEGSMRVCTQCCTNDNSERRDFKKTHQNGREKCCVAMHVGCSMWARSRKGEVHHTRRIFYFPGTAGDNHKKKKLNTSAYCNLHAKDLSRAGIPQATTIQHPPHTRVARPSVRIPDRRPSDLGEAKPAYQSRRPSANSGRSKLNERIRRHESQRSISASARATSRGATSRSQSVGTARRSSEKQRFSEAAASTAKATLPSREYDGASTGDPRSMLQLERQKKATKQSQVQEGTRTSKDQRSNQGLAEKKSATKASTLPELQSTAASKPSHKKPVQEQPAAEVTGKANSQRPEKVSKKAKKKGVETQLAGKKVAKAVANSISTSEKISPKETGSAKASSQTELLSKAIEKEVTKEAVTTDVGAKPQLAEQRPAEVIANNVLPKPTLQRRTSSKGKLLKPTHLLVPKPATLQQRKSSGTAQSMQDVAKLRNSANSAPAGKSGDSSSLDVSAFSPLVPKKRKHVTETVVGDTRISSAPLLTQKVVGSVDAVPVILPRKSMKTGNSDATARKPMPSEPLQTDGPLLSHPPNDPAAASVAVPIVEAVDIEVDVSPVAAEVEVPRTELDSVVANATEGSAQVENPLQTPEADQQHMEVEAAETELATAPLTHTAEGGAQTSDLLETPEANSDHLIQEILQEEQRCHLSAVLKGFRAKWKNSKNFASVWETVCRTVSEKLDYSFQKTEWEKIGIDGVPAQVEVLWEGEPPEPLPVGCLLGSNGAAEAPVDDLVDSWIV